MPKSLLDNKRETDLLHVLGLKQPYRSIRFIDVAEAKQRISTVQNYNNQTEENGFNHEINFMIS